MSRTLTLAATFAVVCLFIAPTVAWGPIGHATVAALAQSRLSREANAMVTKLLNGQSMASVASWADDVRPQPEWSWSAPLHYLNTPDQKCSYQYTRDCVDGNLKGYCVAGAIANFTSQITANDVTADQALKFVIHFVGDIHQPLHCGFDGDEGGNLVNITYFGQQERLHAIWDTNMIDTMLDRFYNGKSDGWLKDLQKRVASGGEWSQNATQWAKCDDSTTQNCITPIADESIQAACEYSYQCQSQGSAPCHSEGVLTQPALADAYFNASYPVINQRIAQGGVRLAAFLNRLVSPAKPTQQ